MWSAVGISAIEERVYRAMLRDPDITVADCAQSLGISPGRCRASIRRLVAAGLLEHTGTRAGSARPVDPRVALGSLIRGRQGELDRLDAAISTRFRDLLSSAEHDIVCLDAPPYVLDSDECEALEVSALRRGARFRSLYSTEALNNPGKLAYINAMVRTGEQARLLRTVPLKLFVVDRGTAVLPLTGSEAGSRFRAVVIQRSTLTDALYALFEVLWRDAIPWPADPSGNGSGPRPGGGAALTDDEHALLRYLVSGMKDEAIARHLGCSRRTLRRRIDALLDRLGATSRFQAGALAAQRGWLGTRRTPEPAASAGTVRKLP